MMTLSHGFGSVPPLRRSRDVGAGGGGVGWGNSAGSSRRRLGKTTRAMVKPGSLPLQPRAYEDWSKVEPTIQKWKPVPAGGLPNTQEKVDAMPPQYKCVDCGGHRVFGVGKQEKARYGFSGKLFYFCKACGRELKAEDRAADNKKIALNKLAAKEHGA
jgi:DNA-directed RNA polymerase subunit RPC12/RpoP